jgi:transketolase
MALRAKLDNLSYRVFVILGDGELDEGSNWESFMFASHHNLSQLTVVIDRNMLQSMKSTEETLSLEPLADKFNSFGWFVININGHNHKELYSAMQYRGEKPVVVIANTIKGKGVSYMENKVEWHYRTPKDDFFDKAMEDLDEIT